MRYSVNNYYKITKSDIDKVPCARIFKNTIDKYIQASCKRVLYKSMTRTDGYRNDEVAEIIDTNGNIVLQLGGKDGHVDTFSEAFEELMMRAPFQSLIFVHNHPNNSSLSFNDLQSFIYEYSQLAIIAVSNNGCVSYALKISQDDSFYIRISNFISSRTPLKAEDRISPAKIRTDILNNPRKYGLIVGRSNRRV